MPITLNVAYIKGNFTIGKFTPNIVSLSNIV